MKKMLLSIIAVLSLISSARAMNPYIEFQGEKKQLIGWVGMSLLDHNHPFSVTSVIRYEDNKFVLKGDILNLEEQDVEEIGAGNCVYVPFYTKMKTRLSINMYEDVGAIVLGTRDQGIFNRLFMAANFGLFKSLQK